MGYFSMPPPDPTVSDLVRCAEQNIALWRQHEADGGCAYLLQMVAGHLDRAAKKLSASPEQKP